MIHRNLYAMNYQFVMGMPWHADGLTLSYNFLF